MRDRKERGEPAEKSSSSKHGRGDRDNTEISNYRVSLAYNENNYSAAVSIFEAPCLQGYTHRNCNSTTTTNNNLHPRPPFRAKQHKTT